MRVTENTNFDVVRDSIRRSRERMEDLQHQSSTLKKINQPSDDPIGASKILELRTDKVNNDQYQMNSKLAEAFLENTDHALSDLSEIVSRAKEIAINQSSAASSSDETRLGVSEEVTQLFKQAVAVANRRIGDRYLFGGYKTQRPPVGPEGKYLGDNGQMMVEIANNVFISMNIPGQEAFNTNPRVAQRNSHTYERELKKEISKEANKEYKKEVKNDVRDGIEELTGFDGLSEEEETENVNLFDELQDFRIALLTGSMEAIHSTLERFDQMYSKLVATRSKVGSRIQGVQSTTNAIERHNVTNSMLTSSIEDADMAQVVSDLTKEETVFRSSLASSKRLIQPTLLDFLK